MSRLKTLFKGPTAAVAVPSSAGLGAFRRLQLEALKQFDDEVRLTRSARRVRKMLMRTGSAFAFGFVIAGAASNLLSFEAAAVTVDGRPAMTAQQRQLDQDVQNALLFVERSAADLYALKTTGASPSEVADKKADVLSAAYKARGVLSLARTNGAADVTLSEAEERVRLMVESDLGKMGVDLTSITGVGAAANGCRKAARPASGGSCPGVG